MLRPLYRFCRRVALGCDVRRIPTGLMSSPLPIATARERAGLSVPDLALLIGINDASCWDLMVHETELNSNLSLRQILRAASGLRVSPLALLPESVTPARERRRFDEMAQQVTLFCAARGITADQFGDLVGWEVRSLLDGPGSVLDDWSLDCLRDVSAGLGLHWPEFLHDEHHRARPDAPLELPPDASNSGAPVHQALDSRPEPAPDGGR